MPAPTTYEHLPTVTYVPEKTVTYYLDPDDGPEKNALLFLSPKGPKVVSGFESIEMFWLFLSVFKP